MKIVSKYNLFKALSILETCVPSLLVALSYKDSVVSSSGASISFVGIIGVLMALLFFKDKIAENFKMPSPFIVASILFLIIILIENLLIPVKFTCLVVMISCGIDELTFKRIYKKIEYQMPDKSEAHKFMGFYTCKSDTLLGDNTK